MIPQKRVAIYARVSTVDKGQDPETQLVGLREYATRRGFELVGEYVDYASGRRDDRPHYRRLMEAARKRHLDIVLVWRYDRFARSTQALVQALQEFQRLRVDFISYQENIDTTTPQGEMIFTVMASLAQFESALISARVKAGMARARAGQTDLAGTTGCCCATAHCRALSPGTLDSSDWQAPRHWVWDGVELRPARQDGGTRRRAADSTVNF